MRLKSLRLTAVDQYTEDDFETRQVFDIEISRLVTEYQAQRLMNLESAVDRYKTLPDYVQLSAIQK